MACVNLVFTLHDGNISSLKQLYVSSDQKQLKTQPCLLDWYFKTCIESALLEKNKIETP